MIYFDQAATSFPTLPAVIDEMVHVMEHAGGSPGRGTHHLGMKASDLVRKTRVKASELFGCDEPNQCLFFASATVGLNQAILGYPWEEGDHIIASSMEHNAVRRPLEAIRIEKQITITYIPWTGNQSEFVNRVRQSIRPKTKMIVMTHASNVTGDILPINEVCALVADNDAITTLVDASQTAGHLSIEMNSNHIDMLAFPGHKGLRGPQGIGMLLINRKIDLHPIHFGGTGRQSLSPTPPKQWPHRFEVGTLNVPAIAGLHASFIDVEQKMAENVSRETKLIQLLLEGLKQIKGIEIYGPEVDDKRVPLVAWNMEGIDSDEIALILDTHYNIAVRAGLHCNALGHDTLGTIDQGVIRASINVTNTEEEVHQFLEAVHEIAQSYIEQ